MKINVRYFIFHWKVKSHWKYIWHDCWKEKQRCQLSLQPVAVAPRYKWSKAYKSATALTYSSIFMSLKHAEYPKHYFYYSFLSCLLTIFLLRLLSQCSSERSAVPCCYCCPCHCCSHTFAFQSPTSHREKLLTSLPAVLSLGSDNGIHIPRPNLTELNFKA